MGTAKANKDKKHQQNGAIAKQFPVAFYGRVMTFTLKNNVTANVINHYTVNI